MTYDNSTQAQLERWARYPMEKKMSITKLEAVNYDDRTDIIEPLGWPDIASMEAEVEVVNTETFTEIIEEVKGWGEYTHLIRTTDEFDDKRYYLATIEGSRV